MKEALKDICKSVLIVLAFFAVIVYLAFDTDRIYHQEHRQGIQKFYYYPEEEFGVDKK
ncbi:hypothetical protein [Atopobacter sp. AH10]|uniref:hypothetical protein n=1 Tax=Atopobacter sp. AH10 TaxID=2315861 RepID=UPI0013141666|nr:hypothetical protein [Atopobacter sp. AH10]